MSQFRRPNSDIVTGTWTITPLWEKINEPIVNDSPFITCPDNSNSTFEVGLTQILAILNTQSTLRLRARKSADGGNARGLNISLVSGSTTIFSTTITDLTGAFATITGGFTNTLAAANDLKLVVTSTGTTTGSGANRRTIEISWVELQTPGPAPIISDFNAEGEMGLTASANIDNNTSGPEIFINGQPFTDIFINGEQATEAYLNGKKVFPNEPATQYLLEMYNSVASLSLRRLTTNQQYAVQLRDENSTITELTPENILLGINVPTPLGKATRFYIPNSTNYFTRSNFFHHMNIWESNSQVFLNGLPAVNNEIGALQIGTSSIEAISLSAYSEIFLFVVFDFKSGTDVEYLFSHGNFNTTNSGLRLSYDNNEKAFQLAQRRSADASLIQFPYEEYGQVLVTGQIKANAVWPSIGKLWVNGVELTMDNSTQPTSNQLNTSTFTSAVVNVFLNGGGGGAVRSKLQEFLLFPKIDDDTRIQIENNIMQYYGIS